MWQVEKNGFIATVKALSIRDDNSSMGAKTIWTYRIRHKNGFELRSEHLGDEKVAKGKAEKLLTLLGAQS